MVYNPGTHNFQSLVLHAVTLLHDVRAGKNRRAASNALRFIGGYVWEEQHAGRHAKGHPALQQRCLEGLQESQLLYLAKL